MILRAITLAGGLFIGAGASQFPEFSQQYAQRLGGAVDALSEVVADFDASAAAEGLTRAAALKEMQGNDFTERRRRDMERTFVRFEKLNEDLQLLSDASPFMRAYYGARMRDRDVAVAAWEAFEPAVPITFAGVIFAGAGFLLGCFAISGFITLLRWPLRRLSA